MGSALEFYDVGGFQLFTRTGGRITARIAWYDEGRIDWTATLVVRHRIVTATGYGY